LKKVQIRESEASSADDCGADVEYVRANTGVEIAKKAANSDVVARRVSRHHPF
jgi:hypothetical protein